MSDPTGAGDEDLFELLVQNSKDAMVLVQDGLFVFANEAFVSMSGASLDEIDGHDYLGFVAPEDRTLLSENYRRRMAGEVFPDRYDFRMLRKDGSTLLVEMFVNVVTFRGRQAVVSCFRDVTERKRTEDALRDSEARYRSVSELVSDWAYALRVEADGAIHQEWVTQAYEKVTDFTPGEIDSLEEWLQLVHPDDVTKVEARFEHLLRGETQITEFRFQNRQGRYRWLRDFAQPVTGDDPSRVVRIIGATKDITEVKDGEAEKEELRRRLAQAQKMESIGTLAGGVAHDVNNILSAVMSAASLVQDSLPPDHENAEDLDIIVRACSRGGALTRSLLAFARKGKDTVSIFSMEALVNETLDLLGHSIPRLIRITLEVEPDLRPVEGDRDQIGQAVMNILLNGAEALDGEGTLQIVIGNLAVGTESLAASLQVPQGEFVKLRVRDNGRGIPPEILEQIFEPFFTTKSSTRGSGLGLSMAYGTAMNHGGNIQVTSSPDDGTEFTLLLPAGRSPVGQTRSPDSDEQPLGADQTILLVDDEEMLRKVGKKILEKAGYSVLLAGDGQEGLEVYRQHRDHIRLVILDLSMPVMDGAATLRELTKISPHLPILIASGYSADEQVTTLLNQGASGFLEKPYGSKQLGRRVAELLNPSGASS